MVKPSGMSIMEALNLWSCPHGLPKPLQVFYRVKISSIKTNYADYQLVQRQRHKCTSHMEMSKYKNYDCEKYIPLSDFKEWIEDIKLNLRSGHFSHAHVLGFLQLPPSCMLMVSTQTAQRKVGGSVRQPPATKKQLQYFTDGETALSSIYTQTALLFFRGHCHFRMYM